MPEVELLRTDEAGEQLLHRLRTLLDAAFDGDFSDDDWAHGLGGWHAVVSDGGVVVAHASVVPRVLEVAGRALRTGYVESVATDPARQGQGLGSLAMRTLVKAVRAEHEMGALATGRHAFYEGLGWERWRGPTFVRAGTGLVRTEDEDDAVMVLRFGASADVDLAAPLSCESRPGDAW